MNDNNTKHCYKIIIILTTICFLINCSQQPSEDITDNITAQNQPKSHGIISKKTYQQKLTSWLRPYQIDVQQGNVLTNEMLEKVKVGMNKQQIKQILGTPVLSESLDKDEWLYIYTEAERGALKKQQKLVLSFKENTLSDIK